MTDMSAFQHNFWSCCVYAGVVYKAEQLTIELKIHETVQDMVKIDTREKSETHLSFSKRFWTCELHFNGSSCSLFVLFSPYL